MRTVDGAALRRLRSAKGWSQAQLVEKVSKAMQDSLVDEAVSQRLIATAEAGGRISLKKVNALAVVLDVDTADLILQPRCEMISSNDPKLQASFAVYHSLFPDPAKRDDDLDIEQWLLESEVAEASGSPFREIYCGWNRGSEVLGMAFVTARIDRDWCFGNYFGLLQNARRWEAPLRDDGAGDFVAKIFADHLTQHIRRTAPRVKGIVFEVDPVDVAVLERAVGHDPIRQFVRDEKFCDHMRNLLRLQLYELWGAKALLDGSGQPLQYYQPAIQDPIGPDREVPLFLMAKIFDTTLPKEMDYRDVLDFVFIDLFGLGYEDIHEDYGKYAKGVRSRMISRLKKGWRWDRVPIHADLRRLAIKAWREGLWDELAL